MSPKIKELMNLLSYYWSMGLRDEAELVRRLIERERILQLNGEAA